MREHGAGVRYNADTLAPAADQASTDGRRYARVLCAAFVPVWLWSLRNAKYPADWWLENWLVIAFAALLVVIWRRAPLSRASCTAIFLFLCLHEIGAHYTYSEVPYDRWFESLTGRTLGSLMGWQRNHFDRLVHFLYGLLLVVPIREIVVRETKIAGAWSYVLPLSVTMATSVVYEMVEWAAAVVFGGDLGMAYLGTQGDVWDGHKDMGLASIGALLMMIAAALRSRSAAR